MNNGRIVVAEAIGTTILMLGGPGVAVLAAGSLDGAATLGVALGFGLALLIAAYTIGHISGAHINPAVTLGMLLMRKINTNRATAYWIGQLIGAVVGGFLIWIIAKAADGPFDARPGNFATNLWDRGNGFAGFWSMAIAEIILTALLVLVVLSTTRKGYTAATVGLHVGLTLTLIHLISIPVDNTSVNPARSLGMAIFAGGDAIEQLWAFFLFPMIGAVLGVLLWLALDDDASIEDTLIADAPLGLGDRLTDARDAAGGVVGRSEFMGETDASADATGGGTATAQRLVGDSGGAGSAAAAGGAADSGGAGGGSMTIGDHALDGGSGDADAESGAMAAQGLVGDSSGAEDEYVHPYGAGSHAVLADDSMPEGYPVKGNIDSMLYHRPDSRNYGATGAEVWFDSGATAEASGFALSPTHASVEDPALHPYGEGSHDVLADGSMPDGYPIKGNIDSMLYHRPDSRNYGATGAEVWFDSGNRAEASGFGLSPTHSGADMHPFGTGSHAPLPDHATPDGYSIKGNVDSMLYHRPDSRNYGATVAEMWFDTVESAESAGFKLSPTHPES